MDTRDLPEEMKRAFDAFDSSDRRRERNTHSESSEWRFMRRSRAGGLGSRQREQGQGLVEAMGRNSGFWSSIQRVVC